MAKKCEATKSLVPYTHGIWCRETSPKELYPIRFAGGSTLPWGVGDTPGCPFTLLRKVTQPSAMSTILSLVSSYVVRETRCYFRTQVLQTQKMLHSVTAWWLTPYEDYYFGCCMPKLLASCRVEGLEQNPIPPLVEKRPYKVQRQHCILKLLFGGHATE